ncbi:MAG TPA: hypothetical protein DEB28_02830 [Hyphomonas sp.]|jgi:protein required for attachment to host cells|nr:hypothetical protein [Hyphomonas sp.]MAX85255.1 hypothetical protein [Hyphomonas sp.]HAO36615.1 hypothetical protein [Hyphomonas sp.]HAW55558.1 hypothetical protein [Hyphomonas sp.]HBJ40722.1 hypothetical protein [Hyphomonas sp.]|tara:strand:+ start:109 stop:570 length:462 start_codon:yes stop_codon:yes gene_type:complete
MRHMGDSIMHLPTGAFVLVCDGSKALLLENKGDADLLDLRIVEALTDDNPPNRDQSSDRAGRFKTPSGAHAATEQTDWHDIAEERFLSTVAEMALKEIGQSTPASLVVAADPRSLGKLRPMLTDSGSVSILAELNRDLAHHTLPKIEEAISNA